ncbi:hypothetical protein Cni_G11767 [Canna indica]|uniref:Acidic leucine-rich nuclear phosphoprotein 32-related protein n=1 Tax=Canna indica TaxID=4628 RepID=A0AAQ3KAS8_9LILI|nr:hypothetical protein Cni_G11767 [Canna indica]
MDEAWERAVEAALGGLADSSSSVQPPRSLTLDGSVKCPHGRLPPPEILERYQSLEHLSIANVGVSSLEKFPRLRNLQRLILSDNRIAGGLEFLVEAGLESLRDLDLSNNRIQFLEDLSPLAHLRLISLDLYECPVTRIKDYRSRVFGMIRTLKYLDKMDADENERPESDEEEEEEEEEDEEDEEEDPGSGEVDGEDRGERMANGVGNNGAGGIVDVDEEEESDAEEEDTEAGRGTNGNGSERRYHSSNGFRVAPIRAASVDGEEDDEEEDLDIDEDDDEDNDEDLGEEIDAEEGEEEDVVEVHDIVDSDEDDDDGVEEEGEEELDEEEEEDEDGDRDEDHEDVEDEEDDGEPGSSGRMISIEGEIDGHEHGEGDEDEDENGEIGEDDEPEVDDDRYSEEGDGEDEDEDDDTGGEYLVQPIIQPAYETVGSDGCNEDDEDEVDDEEDDLHHGDALPDQPSSSQLNKRKRGKEDNLDDDSVEKMRSSKHR